MTPVYPLPKAPNFEEEEYPTSSKLRSGISLRRTSTALLSYLETLSGDPEVANTIQILEDIRSLSLHPEMPETTASEQTSIVNKVRKNGRRVMELLVEDYMEKNDLQKVDTLSESQKIEMEMHVKLTVQSALDEYKQAIEAIRNRMIAPSSYEPVPYSSEEPEIPKDLMRRVDRPRFGSPADNLTQIVRAVSAVGKGDPELVSAIKNNQKLQSLVAPLAEEKDLARFLTDSYMEQKEAGLMPYGNFEEYLQSILTSITQVCDDRTYARLVIWSPRITIPAAAAPCASENPEDTCISFSEHKTLLYPPVPSEIVHEEASQAAPDVSEGEKAVEKPPAEPAKLAYIYKEDSYEVPAGGHAEITYAMAGSTIRVPAGTSAEIYMVADGVTIVMEGDDSRVSIETAGRYCRSFSVVGANGAILKDSPNLELGRLAAEKLNR